MWTTFGRSSYQHQERSFSFPASTWLLLMPTMHSALYTNILGLCLPIPCLTTSSMITLNVQRESVESLKSDLLLLENIACLVISSILQVRRVKRRGGPSDGWASVHVPLCSPHHQGQASSFILVMCTAAKHHPARPIQVAGSPAQIPKMNEYTTKG